MRRLSALVIASSCTAGALSGWAPAAASTSGCPADATNVVHVGSAAGLRAALAHAVPGAEIRLASGLYVGQFTLSRSGVSAHHVTLCGTRDAVLDGGNLRSGYTLHVSGAQWVDLVGFTIRHGQKGVVVDSSQHVTMRAIAVHDVGYEAIDLRRNTTYSGVYASRIYDTGRVYPQFGEGVYVGSARNNWCAQTKCLPDRSDHATIAGNSIGPGVPAEEIDVKEGTSNGVISGNSFDGRSMTKALSWVDMKGNNWVIRGNTGRDSRVNGFTVTVAVAGWGNNNVFLGNHAIVNASGYGFKIARGAVGDVVYTDNVVQNARDGACNVPEQS